MSVFSELAKRLEAEHREMRISNSERIGSHIQKVTLSFPSKIAKPFQIGSYILPMIGGCVPRAYSVVESDTKHCTIIVSFSSRGVGARFFEAAQTGESVKVYGPFDDYPYRYGTGRPKIFMATGTGVAPFIRMVPEALGEGHACALVLGVPHEEDIPYRDYFEQIAKQNDDFQFYPILSRPAPAWKGGRGYVTQQIGENAEAFRSSDVYVCGVPPMVANTCKELKKAAVPKDQIFIQKFG